MSCTWRYNPPLVVRLAPILGCVAALLQLCWPAAHALHERFAEQSVHAEDAHSDHDHAHHDAHHDHDSEQPHPQHRHDQSHCAACHAIASLRAPGTFAPSVALVTVTIAPPHATEFAAPFVHSSIDLTTAAPRGPPGSC